VKEGETVPVHSVVAVIGVAGEATAASAPAVVPSAAEPEAAPATTTTPAARARQATDAGDAGARLSPAVRKLAQEHGVDVTKIPGTGGGGRVTRADVEAFIAKASGGGAPTASVSAVSPAAGGRVEKMSVMRRKIAEHMLASVRTSPHVYSAYEADFSRIDDLRRQHKDEYAADGAKLSYTAFVAKAVVEAIREHPFVNASVDGENVVYHAGVNLGIAVALEQGLIVPVIRGADRCSMRELCRAIQELAERARTKHLSVDDVQDGTFTITNPGIFGGLWGLPILPQPQVAILAVGSIDPRAVVHEGSIVARPMSYLTLGYDHRLIDGADAGRFLLTLKQRVQEFDESWL
jgi:2-oxoglutarate dehydrogenase E2 component (dihydrolipoamide succinyltransferase)